MARLTEGEPKPPTGDGAAPTPDRAPASSLSGKIWSRTRPTEAPGSRRWNAPPPSSQGPEANDDAGRQHQRNGMSARHGARRRDLIIFAVRASLAGGFSKVTAPCPPKIRPPPARGRVELGLEYAACEAVDPRRIATRGYRNQRHTLGSEEIFFLSRRELTANERFDLVAVELLHLKMRSEPVIDEIGRRVFGAVEKIRTRQQHPRRKSMRPQLYPVRSLIKFLNLII
jgi:hypothetical protein